MTETRLFSIPDEEASIKGSIAAWPDGEAALPEEACIEADGGIE